MRVCKGRPQQRHDAKCPVDSMPYWGWDDAPDEYEAHIEPCTVAVGCEAMAWQGLDVGVCSPGATFGDWSYDPSKAHPHPCTTSKTGAP